MEVSFGDQTGSLYFSRFFSDQSNFFKSYPVPDSIARKTIVTCLLQ